jgi:cytochrome P450 family 2 subfamily W polypeptide 1
MSRVFSLGKRQCPGISLAKTALFLLFTGIMQRYDLLPVPEEKPPSMQIKIGLTMSPKPYNVLLVPRTQHVVQE